MIDIKKVLFTTDFSSSAQQAFSHALFLAEHHNVELHLLNVIQTHRHDMIEPMEQAGNAEMIYKQLCDNAEGRLRDMAEEKSNGITVHPEAVCGINIVQSILEYITTHDIDVVVMGTHGRHGVNRWIMGSISEKIVRLAPCSVITIHGDRTIDTHNPLKNILVPIDFSEYSRKALRTAIDIAGTYGSELHVLHVIEKMNIPSVYGVEKSGFEKRIDEVKERATIEAERLIREFGGDNVRSHVHIVRGHATRTIISFADELSPDLVVIATHGLKGIEYLLIGSVTEKVVRFVQSPVLTVKSKSVIKYLEEQKKSA